MLQSNLLIPDGLTLQVPGDKSISHRSVLFSALCRGTSHIHGFLEAEDPLNTMQAFQKLGTQVEKLSTGSYKITSPGKEKLKLVDGLLDFGNGGTGIRLSAGLLAGLDGVSCILTGDDSLCKRPMGRIIEPLLAMGANISSKAQDGKAPLLIQGRKLQDFHYTSKISSAQVKSCLMLAAISSESSLDYEEPQLSRDHSENMVRFLGGKIVAKTGKYGFLLRPPYQWQASDFRVPGDISSAAFFLVLGCLAQKGSLTVENIGLNPARTGILQVLEDMGANLEYHNRRTECGEPVGDITTFPSELNFASIPADRIPALIDEVPILTIAGLFAKNGFLIRNARELRVKESDRITAMVENLRAMGAEVEEYADGYAVSEVYSLKPALIRSFMDHRIAMSFLVLQKLSGLAIDIDDDSWIDTSFPEFKNILQNFRK